MHGMHFFARIDVTELTSLLAQWRDDSPHAGLLALVAEADRESIVPLLQRLSHDLNIPLFGAVFPALLDQDVFHSRGCILLRFENMPFAGIYELSAPQDVESMARRVAGELDQPHGSSLFMIFDAMVATIATILDELYLHLADRVHYFGVNAGSETFQPMPCLFDSQRIIQNGVLVILLKDHPGAVVEHSYQAPERMISATSTVGNRIITIDWRPAFEVYQEAVKAEYGVTIDRENFYQLAVHFPFGIIRANDEVLVRMPVALEEDGSVFCVGEVPANAILTLLKGPEAGSLRTVEKLTTELHNLFGSLEGLDLLVFYCAGRRIHLGDQAQRELQELKTQTRAAQITGALSLGEIGQARQWGYPSFHNGALVCCRWGQG